MTEERCDSFNWSRPPLLNDVVLKRLGSSGVDCDIERATLESLDPWLFRSERAFAPGGSAKFRGRFSIDCLVDGKRLSLCRCFTGWSSSWLVGAVVMILGAVHRHQLSQSSNMQRGRGYRMQSANQALILSSSMRRRVNRFKGWLTTYEVEKALEELPPVPPWHSFWTAEDQRHVVAS